VRNISEKWELGNSHKGESTLNNPFFGVTLQYSHGGGVLSYRPIQLWNYDQMLGRTHFLEIGYKSKTL